MVTTLERIDAATLCRLLGGWTEGEESLPLLLANALTELIESGALREGAVMPSQRESAIALGIARGTVAEAYGILESRDHLQSYPGSGSRIRRRGIDPTAPLDGRLASFNESSTTLIDLSSGALPGLALVRDAVEQLDGRDIATELDGDGYHPAGLQRLRAGIAGRYTAEGLPTNDHQILVTSGSQQAVWLISHVFLGHGDEVIVEDPTYRGALEAFSAAGARMITVPRSASGLDVSHLESILSRTRPRLLYCQPSAHNPTGSSMSASQISSLAELAKRYGLLVVEDRSNTDLILNDRSSTRLLGRLDPTLSVLSVGTMSKLFWGGLRIGWIRGDGPIISRLTEAKKAIDLATAVLEQMVAADLILAIDAARQQRASSLRSQLRGTVEVLAERAPGWQWTLPAGGTGLWIDTGVDAVALAERASRHGVRLVPGPAFSAYGAFRTFLRLPIWHPVEVLGEALDRMEV